MKYLVTGAAGFIGAVTCQKLLAAGHVVVGIDNLNNYYDVNLKLARLAQFESHEAFTFIKLDISARPAMSELFKTQLFDKVIHLAAQAGVRYSIENPDAYADSNLVGHLNVLEGCRNTKVKHLVYASSSSVYGLNEKTPFETTDSVADVVPRRNDQWTVEQGTPASSSAPYAVYNIGHGSPISLMDFVKAIEDELRIEAKKEFREMQPGDVYQTYADTQDLFAATGYKPQVCIKEGVTEFITWYKGFYNK
mgnify:CR=1 FL=1